MSGIADLVVQNVTHWKYGPDDANPPHYHEFITVRTVRGSQAGLPTTELSRDSTRMFDWSSVVTHGLAFRIDRGQLPAPQSSNERSDIVDPRTFLVPIDLIEIMDPETLEPEDGERRVGGPNIRVQWEPYVPLLVFDKRNRGDLSHDDPCALRVRDFIFLLNQHAESSMVYTEYEWNTWELAASIVRLLLRYRLVWAFDAFPFASPESPHSPNIQQQSDVRQPTGTARSRIEPPPIIRGFEHAYRAETGAYLDEYIFGAEARFASHFVKS